MTGATYPTHYQYNKQQVILFGGYQFQHIY